jgi:hypothetical protein
MHVAVGPVPSASAIAFVDYAERVLGEPNGPGADLPSDVVDGFGAYLVEWRKLAGARSELIWETDVPLELAEYLVHAFYRLAQRVDQRAQLGGGGPPEAGGAFYLSLVEGLLVGLAEEGASGKEFAEHLRTFWPGHQAP